MKFILGFLLWITVIDAASVTWTQSGEDEALDLYRKYCGTGQDEGVHENLQWFCRYPEEDYSSSEEEEIEQDLILTAKPVTQKQLFFVQTEDKNYIHKISVHGDNGISKQDVVIYVIPPKHKHKVDVEGELKVDFETIQPDTFFLKKQPFTFSLPENQPPTDYPKPFGEPFMAKSPGENTITSNPPVTGINAGARKDRMVEDETMQRKNTKTGENGMTGSPMMTGNPMMTGHRIVTGNPTVTENPKMTGNRIMTGNPKMTATGRINTMVTKDKMAGNLMATGEVNTMMRKDIVAEGHSMIRRDTTTGENKPSFSNGHLFTVDAI